MAGNGRLEIAKWHLVIVIFVILLSAVAAHYIALADVKVNAAGIEKNEEAIEGLDEKLDKALIKLDNIARKLDSLVIVLNK